MLDLSSETPATKALYGLDQPVTEDFGRNCLIARRLLERGVRFVQVWSGADNGFPRRNWDSHEDLARDHGDMGQSMDQPAAALIKDLKDRGLLDDTIVIWTTEFGRMPCSQGSKGRDHNPFTFTSWLAGGGIKGGVTYGASDEWSYKAVEHPDLLLRPARHRAPPSGHRPHPPDLPPQRHRPPADRRAWACDQGDIGIMSCQISLELSIPAGCKSRKPENLTGWSAELVWRIISDYGDLASVSGFLLSLVGFGLTIWSAQGARKAAEQANQSVHQIRSQLMANEIAACIQVIRTLHQRLEERAWIKALESCVEAGVQLSRNSSNRELTSEENSRLSRMIDDLKLIHDQIEEIRREKEKGKQLSQRVPSKLNDMLVMLGRLEARLIPRSKEF